MSKILIAFYVLCSSLALIFLKLGTRHGGAPISYINNKPHLNLTPYVLGGILLYGLSFIVYMYLISKFDLGYIIPLTTAFVYLAIFMASAIIFKEVFTTVKIIGIILIVAGLVFLNLKK